MKNSIQNLGIILFAIAPYFAYSQAVQIIGNTSSEPEMRATDSNIVPNFNFALPQNTTVNERWNSEGQVEVPAEGQVQFPEGGQVTFEAEGQVEDFETGNIPPYVNALPNEMAAEVETLVDPNVQTLEQYASPLESAPQEESSVETQVDQNAAMTVDR